MDWLMTSPLAVGMSSWMLTYALHSTLLLGGAWMASRVLGDRHLALQELAWRVALVGALVTATVPSLVGARPLDGALRALHQGTASPAAASPMTTAPAPDVISSPEGTAPRASATVATPAGLDLSPASGAALMLAWLLGAGIALGRLVHARSGLRRLLRDRRRLTLPDRVARLARAMGVRRVVLSASEAIAVPFATGLARPEICCPERMLRELEPSRRDGLLAHEMAHVARRDPAWRLAYRLVEGLLFFQPLNRLGRLRLEDLSELASDELAVRCTGNPIGLAQSLIDVAAWSGHAPAPLPAAAAVSRRSAVAHRVEKLVAGIPEAARPRWAAPLLAGIVGLSALTLPAVTLRAAVADGTALEAWSMTGDVTPPPPPAVPAVEAPPAKADAPQAPAAPSPQAEPVAPATVTSSPPPAPPAPPAPPTAPAPSRQAIDERIEALREKLERQLDQHLEELQARQRELGEGIGPSEEQIRAMTERISELAEAMRPSEQELRELQEQAQEIAEVGRLTEEQTAEIRARARELAEKMRPSEEQIRELNLQVRELTRSLEPTQEQLRQLREQARAMAEELRPHQEEIRRLAEEAANLAREAAPSREEIERMTAAARAQAREMMEEVRQQRAAAREEARREFERQERATAEQDRVDHEGSQTNPHRQDDPQR